MNHACMMEYLDADYVRKLVENLVFSYSDVSEECQRQRPGRKGYSARSIRRFCKKNSILRRSRIRDGDLDRVTALYVSKVKRLQLALIHYTLGCIDHAVPILPQ